MSIKNVLKPCPFCGDNMPYLTRNVSLGEEGLRVFCGTCGSYGGWGKTGDEAEKLWNTRAGEPKRCCANCKYTDVDWCTLSKQQVDFRLQGCILWEGEE